MVKKLSTLERTYGYPQRPTTNAATLFGNDVARKNFVSPLGIGSDRRDIFKQIYKQTSQDWKNLDPHVKKIYLDKRKGMLDEYKQRKTDWYAVFGGSSLHKELEEIKAQISALKKSEKAEKDEHGENT